MKDKANKSKRVLNYMDRVLCPTSGNRPQPANNSANGLRCTKCGQTGHERAK